MKYLWLSLSLYLSVNVCFSKSLCNVDDYLKNKKVDANYLYGIGMSNLDSEKGIKEAESRAVSDLAQKLKLNIKTNSTLGQTTEKSELDSIINIESSMSDLIDIKKIDEIYKTDFKYCFVYSLNLLSNFNKIEVEVNSLLEKERSLLTLVETDPVSFLFEVKKVKVDAHDLNEKIVNIDIFKTLLRKEGEPYAKKIDDLLKQLEKSEEENKKKVPFLIIFDKDTEKLAAKVKVALSREAYLVSFNKKSNQGVLLTLKTLEAPREIKTPLGHTLVMDYSFIVTNQITQKAITSVDTTRAQGFSVNGKRKEALSSLYDQAFIQIIESLNYLIY